MDEPGGHYAKYNKSDRERQIPYDLTHMGNLKNKHKHKQTNKKHHAHKYGEQICGCHRQRVKWVKGVKRYKLSLVKQITPGDVTNSMATVVNNTVLYI